MSAAITYNVAPNSGDRLDGVEPIGSLILWAADIAPANYLLANGMAYSRSQFSDLFAVIGTRFGAGDGSTTFNVPNTVQRVIQGAFVNTLGLTGGAETVTLNVSNLPVHGHQISDPGHTHTQLQGGITSATAPGARTGDPNTPGPQTQSSVTGITVPASLRNQAGNDLIGSVPFSVMNPFICLTYIIRAT